MSSQRLTYQELESLWVSAGGSKAIAPVMAAIAVAESGGNPSSLNTVPPDYSVGLWQINYYGDMYAGRSREFGSPSALLASPTAQARAAVAIYRQQGLRAWSTYTSGAYKRYLNGADASASNPGGGAASAAPASDTHGGSPDCMWGIDLPLAGHVCILTKGQGRAITGALLLTSAVVVAGAGVIILSAYGLKRSGALDVAASAASAVPGAGGLAGRMATGARAVRAAPQTTAQRTAGKERAARAARSEQRAQAREERARAAERRRAEKGGELPPS